MMFAARLLAGDRLTSCRNVSHAALAGLRESALAGDG